MHRRIGSLGVAAEPVQRLTPMLEPAPQHAAPGSALPSSAWNAPKRIALAAAVVTLLSLLLGGMAYAAPEAHLLRIDPRASYADGTPLLTTVVELVQHKRLSTVTSKCARHSGNAQLNCIADELEKPRALYSPFKFPEENAFFTIAVDGADVPTKLVSSRRWGSSKDVPGVGTAWLILIDAAGTMGSRFEEAKRVAKAFVAQMGPQDIVNVMFFDDRTVVKDSGWKADKRLADNFIDTQSGTFPRKGRTRPLFNILKQGATDSFRELGNAGQSLKVPMHQAMLVLSNGSSGSDFSSSATTSLALKDYLTKGRFPEDNKTLPKTPLPVVSVWFPARESEEFFQNARQFMENLANIEIGGLFTIVLDGQATRGVKIARAVQQRFDEMHLVQWKVACVAPRITQTLKLVFKQTNPPIAGDNCIDCPLGIDPSQWPLSIDVEKTTAYAKKKPLYPGGTLRVFGDFCWGSEHQRAELYMVPKNQPLPKTLEGQSLDDAKKARNELITKNMRGKSVASGDTYVEFEVPDTTKFLRGKETKSARIIVYDTFGRRASPATEDTVLEIQAEEAPLPLLLIGVGVFAGVVLLLLVVTLLRGGGRRRKSTGRRQAARAPRPTAAAPRPGPTPRAGGAPAVPVVGAAAVANVSPEPASAAASPSPPAPPAATPEPTRALLTGTPGIYPIAVDTEVKIGRDPGACQICLTEPRVSGVHATLKLEAGALYVRDEGSNNGTCIDGGKIPLHTWQSIPDGGTVKFGPIEFTVRLE